MGGKVDLTGQVFGRLTVIGRTAGPDTKNAYWLCQCSCEAGKTRVVTTAHLLNGDTKSCGCLIGNPLEDMVGRRFNRLVVVKKDETWSGPRIKWVCQCDCGNTTSAFTYLLTSGQTQSCGCYGKAQRRIANTKHGMSDQPLYKVWSAMKARCNNPNDQAYSYYGGRGIKYHPSFETFEGFLMGLPPGYQPGMEMDRKDNNGNYEPGNLRWTTRKQQMLNTRANHRYEYEGEQLTLGEIAEKVNLTPKALEGRLTRGKTLEEAVKPLEEGYLKRDVSRDPMIGRKFGRITVESYSHEVGKNVKLYNCVCDCGTHKVIRGSSLRTGATTSCGCAQREAASTKKTHGLRGTKAYRAYHTMKQACYNANRAGYDTVGGRGIKVSPEWGTFEQFWADLEECPQGHVLVRKDDTKDFSLSNCYWAPTAVAVANRATTRKYFYQGRHWTIPELSQTFKINPRTLAQRLGRGLPVEEVLQPEKLPDKRQLSRKQIVRIKQDLGRFTLQDVAALHNVSYGFVHKISKGTLYEDISEFEDI